MSFPGMYYVKNSEEESILSQGDIFRRFEVKDLPKKSEDVELGFILLTYSCDLEHPEDINYILVCPVLDFNILIKKFLEKNKTKSIIKIKDALTSKINKLFNNDSRFYFFLSPIPNISQYPAYADLQQIIKIHKKYSKEIIANRIISLKNPWREKLGWMTGNLFNRIATLDIRKDTKDNFIEGNEPIIAFFENKINEINNLFNQYINTENPDIKLIKEILIPMCLDNEKVTRKMIFEQLKPTYNDDSEINKILDKIETQLKSKHNKFFEEIFNFQKLHHKLDNFGIIDIFKEKIKELIRDTQNKKI